MFGEAKAEAVVEVASKESKAARTASEYMISSK